MLLLQAVLLIVLLCHHSIAKKPLDDTDSSLRQAPPAPPGLYDFLPHDKEAVYDWNALIKTNTFITAPYGSLCNFSAKIHFQKSTNYVNAKISNLHYNMYVGRLDRSHEFEAEILPLPIETQELENVFRIHYDREGLVKGIVTTEDEREFSRNIKRAVANVFQVNGSIVNGDYLRPGSLVGEEDSLYGRSVVEYTVFPRKSNIEVHKLHEKPDGYFYGDSISNVESKQCDVKSEHPVMQNSKKVYRFTRERGGFVLKNVESVGSIVHYPFHAKSDSQNILVQQTFNLREVVPRRENFAVKNPRVTSTLTYNSYMTLPGGVFDATNGRENIPYDKLLPRVQQMLLDIPKYLDQNHINNKIPDVASGQLVNNIQKLLSKFNLQKLQQLHKTLNDESLPIFYQILPLLSTNSSALHIKNLIVTQQVTTDVAVDLLQRMSENAVPTVTLLQEIEELIHLNSTFDWEVRKVAILTFGTLIHRSYLYEKQFHRVLSSELEEPYDKYVDEYVKILKKSDFKVQMVYIYGLRNMKLSSTLKYLIPAFNGQWSMDRNLRFLSIWAAAAPLLESSDDVIFETLWPIFTNRNEVTEMRIVSFYYIIQSKPSHARLSNLFTYMMDETNHELYHFYHTYLTAILTSTNPCNKELRLKVAQLLKNSPEPKSGSSLARFYGYTDAKYGFGLEFENYVLNTDVLRIQGFFVASHYYNKYQEDHMYYLKTYSGSPADPKAPKPLLEYIASLLLNNKWSEFNHTEAAILKRDKIINCFYFTKDDQPEVLRTLEKLFQGGTTKKNLLRINYEWYQKAVIPTDLGFPALYEFLMPQVDQHQLEISKNSTSADIAYRYVNWVHSRGGLSFYNPFHDAWHGVYRYVAYDAQMPLTLEVSYGGTQGTITWKKSTDSSMNIAGVRSHVKHFTFIKNDYKKISLPPSSYSQQDFHHLKRNNYTFVDVDDINTGQNLYLGVYDSNIHHSNGSFKNQMYQFFKTDTKQVNSPLEHLILFLINWRQFTLLSPTPKIHGFFLKVEPSQKFDVSSISLSYQLQNKTDLSLSYSVKNENQTLRDWSFDASYQTNEEHTEEKMAFNVTRSTLGTKDYEVCVEGFNIRSPQGVFGSLNIVLGSAEGEKSGNSGLIDIAFNGTQLIEEPNVTSKSVFEHYELLITSKNVPSELKKSTIDWWNGLVSYYSSYYTHYVQENEKLDSDIIKIDVKFPKESNVVDLKISTNEDEYELGGLSGYYWNWLGTA